MDNGVLECRYHGWQFGADGGCVANPQASEAQKAGSVGSPTTCLRTFPTQVSVWPIGQCLDHQKNRTCLRFFSAHVSAWPIGERKLCVVDNCLQISTHQLSVSWA